VQIGALTNWSQVKNGVAFCVAIKTDGTLWSWGQGATYGALGLGNVTNYSSPKQVGALTSWTTLCRSMSGSNSVLAIAVN
jgi:alpha-tubulin suppressor-like RCC1 family protein